MQQTGWNALVDASNVFETRMKGTRSAAIARPTHIVVHITGSTNFDSVKNAFLTDQRSAHYVVKQDGALTQFVRDSDAAWHAGIEASSIAAYCSGPDTWQRFLRYLPDMRSSYPRDAIYFDKDLTRIASPVADGYVGQPDGSKWAKYDYFVSRWGANAGPVNFTVSPRPNDYAIGIETMSVGASTPSATVYPDAMYRSLRRLVDDLCGKYAISRDRQHIVGHEDVNPIKRWGWDPNQGFDWTRLLGA